MGGGDPRNDGIEARELLAHVAKLRLLRGDIHVAAQIVDRYDVMAALPCGLDQALVRVELRIAGKEGDLHDGIDLAFRAVRTKE